MVVTDDGQAPPFRANQVQMFAQLMEPQAMFGQPGQNRMQDDYTFEMTGLFDRRRFTGANRADGRDVRVVPESCRSTTARTSPTAAMEFAPGRTYEGLQIVFTQRATDLSGAGHRRSRTGRCSMRRS